MIGKAITCSASAKILLQDVGILYLRLKLQSVGISSPLCCSICLAFHASIPNLLLVLWRIFLQSHVIRLILFSSNVCYLCGKGICYNLAMLTNATQNYLCTSSKASE